MIYIFDEIELNVIFFKFFPLVFNNIPKEKRGLILILKSICVKAIDIFINNQNFGVNTSGKLT